MRFCKVFYLRVFVYDSEVEIVDFTHLIFDL